MLMLPPQIKEHYKKAPGSDKISLDNMHASGSDKISIDNASGSDKKR
jgi:hypothetical protein